MSDPCPFCGGKNIEIEHFGFMQTSDQYRGLCITCGARSARCNSEKDATAEWDTRPLEEALEKLCRVYFEIAAEVIGEDAVREKRDAAIDRDTKEAT